MALSFDDLQLDPKLLQALRKKAFATPTPVQAACIPAALSGKDLVAQARTGTGKTLAYLLPALHRILAGSHGSAGWQALILVPTRELCEQVQHFLARATCRFLFMPRNASSSLACIPCLATSMPSRHTGTL